MLEVVDIHVVVVVWKPGIATSTQVSDDFAKQARAMAETRLDATPNRSNRFGYMLVNW